MGPSALSAAITRVADEQFLRWRPGGGAPLTETSEPAIPILREYYQVGVTRTVTDAQLRSTAYQEKHPWSAVFVSYVLRTAGAGSAFHYSTLHQDYIRAALVNRVQGNTANPFWAFRATEVAPTVGDLVCAERADSGATYDNIAAPQIRASHCDIVTGVEPRRIRVIGGNLSQTVGEKWLRIGPDGKLALTGSQSLFFAVIQYGATQAPAPAPADLVSRVARVMDLLTTRYGFPVNGAAGLVGNLIAESGVQPSRIEGSKPATPLRAKDFRGQVCDFTPEQIRDRSFKHRTGPRLPGVGLAQWTSPNRRTGLFAHTYQGRQLGTAILTDLDAQVDYLVTELRGAYRSVDTILRRPDVTLEQSSDAVVLHFERPAAVLNRPTTDPTVQRVLARRRTNGRQALRIHRNATARPL